MFFGWFFQVLAWFEHWIENEQKPVNVSGRIAVVGRSPMVRAAVHAFFTLHGFVLGKVDAAMCAFHHVRRRC